MEARFLQVEPELLGRLGTEDGLVERLFAAGALPPAFDPARMRERILERGPQLLGGTLANFPPELRAQIEGAIGRTTQALQRGEGGDALFELMKQRLAPPAPASGGTHRSLDLDKAWHGVHWVLCGSVEPDGSLLGQAVLGGEEVSEDFSGYGPARRFDPPKAAELAAALLAPAVEQAAAERFDPAAMNDAQIYPFGWDERARGWIMSALGELRAFYAEAAAADLGVVTCLM